MTETEKLKEQIQRLFRMDLVAIASAEAMDGEPDGKRPCDLLPGAKSVIVFGRKQIHGTVDTMKLKFESGKNAAANSYKAYGAEQAPNLLMINAAYELSRYIEKNYGAVAAAVPCGSLGIQNCIPQDPTLPKTSGGYKMNLPFNISKAAELAGLGELGWNGFFLTVKYGPRIMLGAILTTLALDCDTPYTGPKLCEPEKCGICIRKCPVSAIPEPGSGRSEINANRCTAASCGLRRKFGKTDLLTSEDPSDDELRTALERVSRDFPDHLRKSGCDLCAIYCPVGNEAAAVRKNGGLSHE